MDLEKLRRESREAREFTHTVGECEFRLRIPVRHDWTLALSRVDAEASERARLVMSQRAILESAVVGWIGVRVGTVVPDSDEATTPLAWEPGAVGVLLDARPDLEDALSDALNEATKKRRAAVEADEKN